MERIPKRDIVEWMKEVIDTSYQGAKNYAEAGYQNSNGYRLLGRTGQAFQIVLTEFELKFSEKG